SHPTPTRDQRCGCRWELPVAARSRCSHLARIGASFWTRCRIGPRRHSAQDRAERPRGHSGNCSGKLEPYPQGLGTPQNRESPDLQKRFGDEVELVHGRMRGAEKDRAMARFATGVARILVATTVIEVGVDVPEASVMVIEHAERFGLAQLHQ